MTQVNRDQADGAVSDSASAGVRSVAPAPTREEMVAMVDLLDETAYGFARPGHSVVPASAMDLERANKNLVAGIDALYAELSRRQAESARMEALIAYLNGQKWDDVMPWFRPRDASGEYVEKYIAAETFRDVIDAALEDRS